ncbi:hypothetical protein HS088_TW22G01448 [Tripterygium wilfordii]|uniref:Uncharacterized protein n=1 Tax=Tripterygium wilfordii TaxID=458696 RepID=A0A7J7C0W1_TRIWF|nr:uncharacterized protein LOC119991219 [Tripterygium wilfordii]KAF5727751.1 hypothetical protein HS088_TW22G01448 [Tripterygium wilfordii]
MKRQRNIADSGSSRAAAKLEDEKVKTMTKKKKSQSQGVVDKVGKESPVMAESLSRVGWEEWPWLSGFVDEQMSWGSSWLPNWDVEFVDRAYSTMFSDVAWDDDIWNLKNVKEIPNQ